MNGKYRSLRGEAEATTRIKGSKFIGYSRRVQSQEEAEAFLSAIKTLHPKARHHCYAWRLGNPDPEERANDDGEPSGTAGRPILGQLIKADVTDSMVVVVRYFGGILLGTSGLIQAYRECAEAVLAEATIVVVIEKETWKIDIDFEIVHILEEWAPQLGFTIQDRIHSTSRMRYLMEIPKKESSHSRLHLIAKLLDVYPAEVNSEQNAYEKFKLGLCV